MLSNGGLGIDSKQTICYLRKELQSEKKKVQQLTIQVDDLKDRQQRMSSMRQSRMHSANSSVMSLYEEYPAMLEGIHGLHGLHGLQGVRGRPAMPMTMPVYNDNYVMMMDDEKSQSLRADEPQKGDACREKFERWLGETVKLGQYLSLLRKSECDDVRMIEFFEDEALEKEIGIERTFHRKLILKKAREFKAAQSELGRHLKLKPQHKESLEVHGILSAKDLRKDVHSKQQLVEILGGDKEAKCVETVWEFIQNK